MRTFLVVITFLLLAAAAGGFWLPREVSVEREIVVQRPASTVFTVLNSFSNFEKWSSWRSLDPGVVFTQSGAQAGVDARLDWTGDPARLGTGWQEIVVSEPWRRIDMELHNGPQGDASARFMITGDQLASRVQWTFMTDVTGGRGFLGGLLGRYFGMFLESWVEEDMEVGLGNLKSYLETLPAADFSGADIVVMQAPRIEIASVQGTSSADPAEVALALSSAYQQIAEWARLTAAPLGGQPLAITRAANRETLQFEAAIPLLDQPGFPSPDWTIVKIGFAPVGPAARIIHRGPLTETLVSYQKAEAWVAARGLQLSGTSWEHYMTNPDEVSPEHLETHIYLMLDGLPDGFQLQD